MTDKALLPTGLKDVLPQDAQHEAGVIDTLTSTFASHGYDRVKPPLIEFEDNLLYGSGSAIASQTFRMMDPISQRMLGIRPDMTVQVERIACSRLANAPRPLRLSYSGQVLRVRGSQLRPERQFGQAGAELIGSKTTASDCEVILLGVEALQKAGATNLTVDLGLPTLVPALCAAYDLDEDTQKSLREALDRKDAASVQNLGGVAADLFGTLISCAGPAQKAIDSLLSLDMKGDAVHLRDDLVSVHALIKERAPDLGVTIDPVENRGYEYHTGVTYTFYARGVRGELGRGGRYITRNNEPASGFTLFVDSLMQGLPAPKQIEKVYLPYQTTASEAADLRAEGYTTVNALSIDQDAEGEAKRLGCTHIYLNSSVKPL